MKAIRTSRSQAFLVVMGIIVCGTLAAPALAKNKKVVSRTVAGMVLDKEDNPIPGAVVEMTDVQTGKKLASYATQDGRYQFADLDAHHDYRLQASYKGMTSEVRTASSFDDSNRIILNLRIPPQP